MPTPCDECIHYVLQSNKKGSKRGRLVILWFMDVILLFFTVLTNLFVCVCVCCFSNMKLVLTAYLS